MRILYIGGHILGKIVLQHLIERGRQIIGVFVRDTDDQWYSGVDEVAAYHRLPLFKVKNINDTKSIGVIRDLAPDLIVVVNFRQILSEGIIQIPPKGCINTHASLLPKYRGRAPLNWAIINGEKEAGVTVHYIDKGIDTGDIIVQKRFEIRDTDYISDVLVKVESIYPTIVEEAIRRIEGGRVDPIPQNHVNGFYCAKRGPEDGQIDWNQPINQIHNLIRAVSRPYPGAYTYYGKHKLIIWRAYVSECSATDETYENGTILTATNGRITVKGNGGSLTITDYSFVSGKEEEICREKQFVYKEDL